VCPHPVQKSAGLANKVTYYFAPVTAVNQSNGERKEVTTITATPLAIHRDRDSHTKMVGLPFPVAPTVRSSGLFTLDASDPAEISRVEFYLDGALVWTGPGALPLRILAESCRARDGSHIFRVKSYDTFGNSATTSYDVVVALDPPAAPIILLPARRR